MTGVRRVRVDESHGKLVERWRGGAEHGGVVLWSDAMNAPQATQTAPLKFAGRPFRCPFAHNAFLHASQRRVSSQCAERAINLQGMRKEALLLLPLLLTACF